MSSRAILAIGASALLAGCVNSDGPRNDLGGPPTAIEAERNPAKQTLASKVLGAIAFERVTGRKPDPTRLKQLR
jgi:hypothetical protein